MVYVLGCLPFHFLNLCLCETHVHSEEVLYSFVFYQVIHIQTEKFTKNEKEGRSFGSHHLLLSFFSVLKNDSRVTLYISL